MSSQDFENEEEQMLAIELRALAAEMKSVSAPDRVEEKLRTAFRKQKSVPHVRFATWRYAMTAAAAAVLIGFVLLGLRVWQSRAPTQTAAIPGATELHASGDISTPDVKPPRVLSPKKNRRLSNAQFPKRHTPRNDRPTLTTIHTTPEVVTEFMPLGYVNVANFQDGGQLVRVEMPRYAMARFGLPVNMERYDERVKADVWLGADGLAHAIRFVQ